MKPQDPTKQPSREPHRQPQQQPSALTIGILRQFARCYTVEKRLALPLRAIVIN